MTNQQLDALLSSADDMISGSSNQCMCPGHKKGGANIVNRDNLMGFALGLIACMLYKKSAGGANKHIQGYDDRRDESLSARLGAERKFQHGKYSISEHGRMDDSYGVHGHRGLKGPMMPGF